MKLAAALHIGCLLLAGCRSQTDTKLQSSTSRSAVSPSETAGKVTIDAATQQQLGIQVLPVEATSAASAITSTALLQPNEDRTWQVGAILEGKIVEVPVKLGDNVRSGQELAFMHSHEVFDVRAQRRQAVAELDKLKVLEEQALRVRDRTRRLFDLKAASREQVEAAETQYRSAQLSVLNAQAELEKVEFHLTEFLEVPLGDPRDLTKKDTGLNDRIAIRAPAAGTVMARQVSVGSVVSVGAPVVTVSDLSSLWLIAAVNEAELSQIRKGQHVSVSVRAYPDRTFPGQVFQLGERMDPQTRSLQIRVLVSNQQALLKPDMFATAIFDTPAGRPALYIPEAAIQDVGGKATVFIQNPSGSFEPREVTTGERVDGRVEIRSGLDPGMRVVVKGAFVLKSHILKSDSE